MCQEKTYSQTRHANRQLDILRNKQTHMQTDSGHRKKQTDTCKVRHITKQKHTCKQTVRHDKKQTDRQTARHNNKNTDTHANRK